MSKHTPGPWEVQFIPNPKYPDLGSYTINGFWEDDAVEIARLDAKEPDRADATLIAAAPDMAEALRDIAARLQSYTESTAWEDEDQRALDQAEAALRKAGVE